MPIHNICVTPFPIIAEVIEEHFNEPPPRRLDSPIPAALLLCKTNWFLICGFSSLHRAKVNDIVYTDGKAARPSNIKPNVTNNNSSARIITVE